MLPQAIRAWRLRLPEGDRSLSRAARRLGVSKSQYYRYELGTRKPPPEKVPAIEAITGIPRELIRPDVYRSVGRAEAERVLHAAV